MGWPPLGDRDRRAANILTGRLRVQAWLELPGFAWPGLSFFDDDIVETTVEYGPESDRKSAMLIEFNAAVACLEEDWSADQDKLRRVIARFRFLWLGMPRVICARLIDIGSDSETRLRLRICHPAAVGAPSNPLRAPLSGVPMMQSPFLNKTLRQEVDRALQWYLAALETDDPFVEAAFMWMAIESLAPVQFRVPHCGRCNTELPPCTECHKTIPREVVVASIVAYLNTMLGMTKKEVGKLYDWRSKLVHGKKDRVPLSYEEAADHAGTIRETVNRLLAKELGVKGSGASFRNHPDHIAINLNAVFGGERYENALDEPFPLFKDLRLKATWPS